LQWIDAHRDQLWAEAVALFTAGEAWHPTIAQAQELGLSQIQEVYREKIPAEVILRQVLDTTFSPGAQSKFGGVVLAPDQLDADGRLVRSTIPQLAALGNIDWQREQRTLTHGLRSVGWVSKQELRQGVRAIWWTAPDAKERGQWRARVTN
jgi:predicted P-loop ATPase